MTSTNALAVNKSGTTITSKAPGALLGLLAAVALLAAPAAAFGAETTSTLNGYSATPTISTSSTATQTTATTQVTTASPAVTPGNGAKPENESKPTESTPKSSVKPSSSSASPTSETKAETAKELPFTGLNLVWVIGAGLLLLAAGFSMRIVQRRRAHR
jgi:beta-lactamase regulating signal transducer with metallopeptidase domain